MLIEVLSNISVKTFYSKALCLRSKKAFEHLQKTQIQVVELSNTLIVGVPRSVLL